LRSEGEERAAGGEVKKVGYERGKKRVALGTTQVDLELGVAAG
jgi:hypothetical protein